MRSDVGGKRNVCGVDYTITKLTINVTYIVILYYVCNILKYT